MWRSWEGEYLAYDQGSGDTHCFDSITATLLMRLQNGPAILPALADYIADTLAFETGEELTSHVNELLLELERKNLTSSYQA